MAYDTTTTHAGDLSLYDFKHQHKLSKRDFKHQLPELRATLLELQHQLRDAPFPVIVMFAGVDGAGKSNVVSSLNEWMDPRFIVNRAYLQPSQEEAERPDYWRYWRDLPPKGQIGLFLSGWYSQPLLNRVKRAPDTEAFERELDHIQRFERMLTDDGALVIKFWLHLDKKQQKRQLKQLEADPLTQWRVSDTDWAHWAMYDRFVDAANVLLNANHTPEAPWHVVDGKDEHYRAVHVAEQIKTAITQRLNQPARPLNEPKQPFEASKTDYLSALDMQDSLTQRESEQQLAAYQAELNQLYRRARQRGKSMLLVFEGWDAAGKGGAIRRVLHALDPKYYRVVPIAAPTQDELAQHYLWRFWRHLPRAGRVTVFDRSWYGRVLVERIEGFAQIAEWQRAYAEINEFEAQLTEANTIVCKFWLHIDKDEQLQRFEARAATPHKAWKLTGEDWRNRDKWDDYVVAVNDMLEHTSTAAAPWALIPANDKRAARVKVIAAVCDALNRALQ